MPYVPLPPATRRSRLNEAEARWGVVLTSRPDLGPAVALQQALLGSIIDLAETIEHSPMPRLSLPPRYLAAKLARGVPALRAEPLPLPVLLLRPTLLDLSEKLAKGGAGVAATHIRELIETGRIDAGSLLGASLSRDQQAIRGGAADFDLAPDLLWLIAELAVSPFAHALLNSLLCSDDPALASALSQWNHGYCPGCGSWPALAETASSRRILRCSFCAGAWELAPCTCVYCERDGESLVTAAPAADRQDRQVELCDACGGYLKVIQVQGLSPFPLLAITDLETMDLDLAAMERGYHRPPLKELPTRR